MFNPFSFFGRKPSVPEKREPRRNIQATSSRSSMAPSGRSDRSSDDHIHMAGLGFGAGVMPGSNDDHARQSGTSGQHNSPGAASGGWSAPSRGCDGGGGGDSGSGGDSGGSCGGSD